MKGATNWRSWALVVFAWMATLLGGHAEMCGQQGGGKLCPDDLCCSKYGYCGYTPDYCGEGCQSQCKHAPPPPAEPLPPVPPGGGPVAEIISEELFEELLPHRNDDRCRAKGFYTYDAFIAAADQSFPLFGAEGDLETRKIEIAAFLAQTSHETNGGWPRVPGGQYAWGYCFVEELNPGWDYCVQSTEWPCVGNKSYYGRGPIQLSYNFNYGPAGEAIGEDLLHDPDKVAYDPYVSFETALWFWMTPQHSKPSCHDVIIGKWKPSPGDEAAGRKPGYGMLTNIINGGLECGHPNPSAKNRVGYYKHFCEILGVSPGDNLDCENQRPFGFAAALGGRSVM